MAIWKITKNIIDNNDDHQVSSNFKNDVKLPYKFRLLDDDGKVYFEGLSNDDSSFSPLDDYALPSYGCTEIQYNEFKTEIEKCENIWKTL